ncbi:guanosine monophosphate reductase [Legionella cincinnatiensis]|uniref:GMP reductase n=1 Tax=Legionella cincinnatiensis TaxID=28085 RepID=A0A378IFX0_9GAMM|nr:guanosine monophosphate reductase [Legionella cincinnatiensis]KTC92072.1 guanosine monophosphate reductase GuaC [Legionella cincinnatiensis]STX33625.1 guanosine monophosphate reductase GuaC [Legionella cincinnatiensis]
MTDHAITFDDVLLVPSYNHHESRRVVETTSKDRLGKLTLELPVISSNMDTITESTMANFMTSKGAMGALHRFMSVKDNIEEFKKCSGIVFVSVGCSTAELERAEALRDAGADYFCVDVAHAHAKYVGKTLKNLRKILADRCIMAGNVATYAGADYLASCGADIIKAGIGGGSVCSTRIKTGFGVPMLTCIQDCSRADRSIVADGGIKTSGDIVKALAFGADFVMIGGMLAGTSPTPGEVIQKNDGSKVKRYRGMASKEAQENFLGEMHEWKTAEGVATEVPFKDNPDAIIADIVGGLRSGLTYAGADTISELQRKLNYVIVTQAGRIESLPHKLLG